MSWRNSEELDVQIESEGEMRTLKKSTYPGGDLDDYIRDDAQDSTANG